MERLILAIGLLLIGILSCTNDTFDNSLNGSWTVVSFENLKTGTREFRTYENSWGKDINVQFHVTANPIAISGTNCKNRIFGELSLVEQNQFRVSNFVSTEVNQPRWADEFTVAILDQNLTYKVTGNRLVIYYDYKSKSVTLTKTKM